MKTLNKLSKIFISLSILVLSSCSSLSSLKFWGDDEEEEGPADLYSIQDNRILEREWSVSNGNEISYGRLIPSVYELSLIHI